MPILGYPAHPEHDQVAPAAVVFGVSDQAMPSSTASVDVEALALAQRTEWHVDVSDEAFAELAARAAYGCEDCGHLPGCDCDCCPYQIPAVAGVEQLAGGARS